MRPFAIILLFVALSLSGVALFQLIPFQLLPNTEKPTISVNYDWQGAPASAVEQQVTSVLEGALSSVKDVDKIESKSVKGGGYVQLTFQEKTDMKVAQYEVSSVIRNVAGAFPSQVSYPISSIGGRNADEAPVLVYAVLSPPKFPGLSEFLNDRLAKRVANISGVEKAIAVEAEHEHLSVEYDYYKLSAMNISTAKLVDVVRESQRRFAIGNIRGNNGEQRNLLIQSAWKGKSDWHELPVSSIDDKVVRLGDLAKVQLKSSKPLSYFRINGKATNYLIINAKLAVNQPRLVERIKQELNDVTIPHGISLMLIDDPTENVKIETQSIVLRGLFTLAILLLLVYVVYRSWTYLFLIFIALTANLLIAFFFYYFCDIELHIYSLAGISISFSLLIDTHIVMVEHFVNTRNRKVFIAILASTLTTVAALGVVFFLGDRAKTDLLDFVKIVIINLGAALLVSLFLIPAIIQNFDVKMVKRSFKRQKLNYRLFSLYQNIILRLVMYKRTVFFSAVMLFGIPVFLLPDTAPKNWPLATLYDRTVGGEFYQDNLKKTVDLIFGGSLRLFIQEVNHRGYFKGSPDTKLILKAVMPKGSTASQTNELITQVERYLSDIRQIQRFETSVSELNAKVTIDFKSDVANTFFPARLKSVLTDMVISLGNAEWEIVGIGTGFNNVTNERAGAFQIAVEGYSYDETMSIARHAEALLKTNPRVADININSESHSRKKMEEEFILRTDEEKVTLVNAPLAEIQQNLKKLSGVDEYNGSVAYNGQYKDLVVTSSYAGNFNLWNMNNEFIYFNGAITKLSQFSELVTEKIPLAISKVNQNFKLFINYDFIGPIDLGESNQVEMIAQLRSKLPIGYQINDTDKSRLTEGEKQEQGMSLVVITLAIFFICSILFESVAKPLIMIAIIPFNFIGSFLTYYLFDISFNNGGYAAFILVSGLTVNAVIYILNDTNQFSKRNINVWKEKRSSRSSVRNYLKAFSRNIGAIIITLMSSSLGFVPFLLKDNIDPFWFTLITGTIGGIIFSLCATCFLLPLFCITKKAARSFKNLNHEF